jgi:hypothetical protein
VHVNLHESFKATVNYAGHDSAIPFTLSESYGMPGKLSDEPIERPINIPGETPNPLDAPPAPGVAGTEEKGDQTKKPASPGVPIKR